MKFVLMLLFILQAVTSFAINWYGCNFYSIDPSSINRALGGNGIGVTNIWHNNAMLSHTNPAIAAFHEGISYGVTRDNWLKGWGVREMFYNAGLLSIGYKGIGIILPVPANDGKIGIYMDYSYYPQILRQIKADKRVEFEQANMYGISVNPIDLLRSVNIQTPLSGHFDIAVGVTRKNYNSQFYVTSEEYFESILEKSKGQCTDFGAIVKGNYLIDNNIKIEGVYGASFFNCFEDSLKFAGHNFMIYRHRNHGLAVSLSVLPGDFLINNLKFWNSFFGENLFTCRVMTSFTDDMTYHDNAYGLGSELGALDTVFLRYGWYDGRDNDVKGNSYGIGINLHYKNLVTYTFNYANFPGGDLVDQQNSTDHNLTINFIDVYKAFKK